MELIAVGVGVMVSPIWGLSIAIGGLLLFAFSIWKILQISNGKRRKREMLSCLLSQGQELQTQCKKEKEPAPKDAIQDWITNCERILSKKFGQSYVVRFRIEAGITKPIFTYSSFEHGQLYIQVHYKLARLEEFLREVGN